MTVIGLDLSLTAPGWFKREPSGAIKTGTFDPGKLRGVERMHAIARFVMELLRGWADGEVLVVIEGFSFGSKGSSVYEIAGLGYIVRYALWHRKIRFIEVAPTAVKKFATGKAKAEKNIIIREVYKRWKFEAEDDNQADAFVLGQIGMYLSGISPGTELTTFQWDVLKGIKY